MYVNDMPRYEILSEEAMDVLDRGWRRIVSELGVEFMLPEAVEYFREAGQRVEGEKVFLDPDFLLEQAAKAPREFELQARNPDKSIHVGGNHMAFAPVYGPPFVREGDVRRDAKMADFENFVKLSQTFDELDSPGGTVVEPEDRPLDSRHLDMVYALQTLSDKPYMGSVISAENARDTIAMGEILFGGAEALERSPVSISLINCNSPLRWDDRMLSAMLEYNRRNQAVVVTPFLLMGAMSPVSIPATLVQQMAEALSGIALTQLVQPGCPVVFGSFLSNTDMQSGSPSFGTPESAIGLLCTGQIARSFGLPFRSGGGLNASQTTDAQAAYEALMTMLPTFLAGANFVMHAAGWLEGGLVSCYEKFIVDIELLRMLKHEFKPLEVTEESLAFDAHEEVGSGGHFLGAAHTLLNFRECFYRPLLSSTENFDRWTKNGGLDANARAAKIWREQLEAYEQPEIDHGVRDELRDYVARRRIELGDEPVPTPAF
ncbi:MAG: trimethylamine---corrinoid protein Co-methyltransferase [Thermoleophilaceae bacterium]|jgi:trimethylamine--corrinoid protein Co-methyltransferase|nr:trimethylamine---corrinoid protein Co-methyltransferase [Thermoleophilaceae bacterium]MEA2403272.1 trimethylamine---corrinoid protein Co-methyltransferase [Thermoleophilaceae bacterium]